MNTDLHNRYGSLRRTASRLKRRIEGWVGYSRTDWLRQRQVQDWKAFFARLAPERLSCLEISPSPHSPWRTMGFADYRTADYPEFDICSMRLPTRFAVVILDQVLEHVADPVQAVGNAREMLAKDGWLLVAAPFLFRVHNRPGDYTRWTAAGLTELLVKGGFGRPAITAHSWGNRACVRAHIGSRHVIPFGFGKPMENDHEYPIMVWAFARNESAP